MSSAEPAALGEPVRASVSSEPEVCASWGAPEDTYGDGGVVTPVSLVMTGGPGGVSVHLTLPVPDGDYDPSVMARLAGDLAKLYSVEAGAVVLCPERDPADPEFVEFNPELQPADCVCRH